VETSLPRVILVDLSEASREVMVRRLLARGYDVTTYDIAPFDYPERSQIREVTGDIRDPAIPQVVLVASGSVADRAA